MTRQRVLRILLYCLAVGAILFSGRQLLAYHRETGAGAEVTRQLSEKAITPVTPGPAPTPAPAAETTPVPYDEYAPFTVDFDVLRADCADIVAWLYCEDTPINYPIVQGDDNEFYVEHLPDGSWNGVGTLFLDFVNEPDFSDFNSIVYGHNMLNDSMFGVVTEYYRQEYYEAHPVMYLMTPEQYYRVDLVAGVVTPTDSWMYKLDYTDPQRKTDFVEVLRQESSFRPEADFDEEDRFLTLSTCTYDYDYARYLLVGKLIPIGGADAH